MSDKPPVVIAEVIEYVADKIVNRYHKHQIKRLLEVELEITCAVKTFETLYSRAKEVLVKRSKASWQEHFANAVGYYEWVIREADAPIREKLLAQARLDNLLGLDASVRAAMSEDEQAAAAREALRAMAATNRLAAETAPQLPPPPGRTRQAG